MISQSVRHDGISNEARDRAQKNAIAWLDEHLKLVSTGVKRGEESDAPE
ncbi:MAG TPA: hypothetical protein VKE74_32325 [Gemmataceae bacterium]|nr:hypothetical protein [Gemmataceae bacterium]